MLNTFGLAACFLSAVALFETSLGAQEGEPLDGAAIAILRDHGLEKSQVMEHLSWICDVHGPRLTGSLNLRRASKWAVAQFAEWGLDHPHLEPWGPFGRGWQLDYFNMTALGENPWPVHAWPKAWSSGFPGRVEGEVVRVSNMTADDLKALDLSDKIVLLEDPREVSEPFGGEIERFGDAELKSMAEGAPSSGRPGSRSGDFRRGFARRAAVLQLVYNKRPLAILDRYAKGDYGTIFVSSASVPSVPSADGSRTVRMRPWDPKAPRVIPQFTLAVEHYNRICRLLAKGMPVRLGMELRTRYFDDDPMQNNVIAEIKGVDPKIGDQIVMLGAHFDSWHSGTGATDNGTGSAVMMEAVRLLKVLTAEVGHGPRRTIRIALWTGEEQGLLGSRAYVREHFGGAASQGGQPPDVTPEHARLAGYFNLDNGTGRIRGVYMQGNKAVAPIFRTWLKPFHDLDAKTLTVNNTGGTDHLAFDAVGLPGFQFIQDPVGYSTKTHHSNMDSWDHAVENDLKQAATIIASFVWHTAQRDEILPRKPQVVPGDADTRRRR